MSNFTGVTFAQQKVLPSDDAIIRRSILIDGILYGCTLSYSGSTLTMAEGQMLICGRQIRHPSSQNWAVVDATSGFARLVLTVDMTKTSTKEVFEQVVDSIEYASAVDGFPELEQTNVNVSGTRYQVVACVVSLGTGGITGIVSQLGPCEATGGGGLNFSVVGGLTQPADPKDNMIWVATDVDITSYIFSATEPEAPADGLDGPVWITTGTASTVAFNALKKNSVMVYPLSAKQYIGGAWVNVTAKSYQNGEWVEWLLQLYNTGDTCDNVTGGWVAEAKQTSGVADNAGIPTVTDNGDSVTLSGQANRGGVYRAKNKIRIAGKSKIVYIGDNANTPLEHRSLIVWSAMSDYWNQNIVATVNIPQGTDATAEIDLSGVPDGEYYIGLFVYNAFPITMKRLYIE